MVNVCMCGIICRFTQRALHCLVLLTAACLDSPFEVAHREGLAAQLPLVRVREVGDFPCVLAVQVRRLAPCGHAKMEWRHMHCRLPLLPPPHASKGHHCERDQCCTEYNAWGLPRSSLSK